MRRINQVIATVVVIIITFFYGSQADEQEVAEALIRRVNEGDMKSVSMETPLQICHHGQMSELAEMFILPNVESSGVPLLPPSGIGYL